MAKASFITWVPVRNMDRAIHFYTEMLGGKLASRGKAEMKDYWASVKVGRAVFWMMAVETQEKRVLSQRDARSSFVVDDIKTEVDELKKKGVRFQRP